MDSISDPELLDFLPQLVQVTKALYLTSSFHAGTIFPPFPLTLICFLPVCLFTFRPFCSHPLISPSPSNKSPSNTSSLCRRWSTSVIWTVTWCVFCWGGPSGMCALLTTSSGVSSALRLYLKIQCACIIEHTYWEIGSCCLILSHSVLNGCTRDEIWIFNLSAPWMLDNLYTQSHALHM